MERQGNQHHISLLAREDLIPESALAETRTNEIRVTVQSTSDIDPYKVDVNYKVGGIGTRIWYDDVSDDEEEDSDENVQFYITLTSDWEVDEEDFAVEFKGNCLRMTLLSLQIFDPEVTVVEVGSRAVEIGIGGREGFIHTDDEWRERWPQNLAWKKIASLPPVLPSFVSPLKAPDLREAFPRHFQHEEAWSRLMGQGRGWVAEWVMGTHGLGGYGAWAEGRGHDQILGEESEDARQGAPNEGWRAPREWDAIFDAPRIDAPIKVQPQGVVENQMENQVENQSKGAAPSESEPPSPTTSSPAASG